MSGLAHTGAADPAAGGLGMGGRVPRLALRPEEAAEALGVSRSFFFERVLPQLRVVRCGRVRLVAVSELQRWLEQNAARVLEGR